MDTFNSFLDGHFQFFAYKLLIHISNLAKKNGDLKNAEMRMIIKKHTYGHLGHSTSSSSERALI